LDLIDNATDATEVEALPSETVEVSAEKIEETTQENMNELKDTIDTSTESTVDTVSTAVELETIEEPTLIDSIEGTIAEVAVENKIDDSTLATPLEVAHSEDIIAIAETSSEEEIPHLALEPIEDVPSQEDIDYSSFSKKDFVDLGEKLLASIKAEGVSASDVKMLM